jgi:hypothetical protein
MGLQRRGKRVASENIEIVAKVLRNRGRLGSAIDALAA